MSLKLVIGNKNYSSWSLRAWLAMELTGSPYDEVRIPLYQADSHKRLLGYSPTAKVPVLQCEDGSVWDSLAITEYVAEEHPAVWPADRGARTWARSAAAEMHSGFTALRNQCGMSCGVRVALREVPADLRKDVARVDELWCEGLQRFGGPFLAGDTFTAVDAFFAPVAFRAQTYNLPLSATAAAYRERLLALPAMREWYEAALQETWREPGHEAEVLGAGDLVADYRHTA